jgi:DNA-directed RNA polymerase specialized sigma24 family protein
MMVYYDEIPQKEAAENMGISLKALESILSRAKAILKERMDERVKKIV